MSFKYEITNILAKENVYDEKIKKYKCINTCFFVLNIFCTIFIVIVPYNWYLSANLINWLERYEESVSIAYILDVNINKLNAFYYINVFPFVCLSISIIVLMTYKTHGKKKNYERYMLQRSNNEFPETVFPVLFVLFVVWFYCTPPSYEERSLALLNFVVTNKIGFAMLNLSISFMLIFLSSITMVALYNHYFLRDKQ